MSAPIVPPPRGEIFRLRLTAAEKERLEREAREAGLTMSDLFRTKLGWERRTGPSLTPAQPARTLVARVRSTDADPKAEPGKAALERLAARIAQD